MPGEKTTITLKTFTEITETQSRSQNIIDSFSKESADEFEKTLSSEENSTDSYENESSIDSTKEITNNVSMSLDISATVYKVGKIAASASKDKNTFNSQNSTSATKQIRDKSINSLSEAINKHTNNTNSSREMEVNTTSNSSYTQSTEQSTVRELTNPNQNRVLNFVFRQLLQEYISVTYLNTIKIGFTNGHPEFTKIVSIQELDQLLESVIQPKFIEYVKEFIVSEYKQVENYRNELIDFLEIVNFKKPVLKLPQTVEDFLSSQTDNRAKLPNIDTNLLSPEINLLNFTNTKYYKKTANLSDFYQLPGDSGLKINVNGVILKIDTNTLRTPSVIVDALLGQGDALDCFNQMQQQASIDEIVTQNLKEQQLINNLEVDKKKSELAMEIIRNLPPEQQSEAYRIMFKDCCNTGTININKV